MNSWSSLFLALFAVIVLVLLALLGVGTVGLATLFGVVIPYAAGVVFVLGVVWRVVRWAGRRFLSDSLNLRTGQNASLDQGEQS